jgi:hypothetical protein
MGIFKRSAGLLVIALALFAIAATAPASAANPEFLDNVTGNTFTAKSGKGELKAAAPIVCQSDKITLENGKVTGAKTILVVIDFEKCAVAGFAPQSLSDTEGKILVAATGELCYINKAEKHVGVLFTITPVHIEVPSLGELLIISGTMLGLLKPPNMLSAVTQPTLTINATTAKEKCEGGVLDELTLEKNHNGKPEAATETTTEELIFDKDIEVMA